MPPDNDMDLGGQLSGYFEKKQKPKGPTAAPEVPVGMSSAQPAAPRFLGGGAAASAPAGAGAGARAPGGKSPTGFVGFERYFSANEPAIQAEAKKTVSEAAGPAGTKTMSMGGRPTMEIGPSFAGGQYSATRMGQAPSTTIAKPTQMQRGEARAAKESVGKLTEPGAYQAQTGGQTKAQADFNAMLLQGVLPEEAKAEQKRLGALEQRLGEQAQANALGAFAEASAAGAERVNAFREEDDAYFAKIAEREAAAARGGAGGEGMVALSEDKKNWMRQQRASGDTRSMEELAKAYDQQYRLDGTPRNA